MVSVATYLKNGLTIALSISISSACPVTDPAHKSCRIPLAVTQAEVEALYKRFRSLDRSKKGFISAEELLGIPELSINPLAQRLVSSSSSSSEARHYSWMWLCRHCTAA
jgi:hypothetical protein